MNSPEDTIAAIATPLGEGGLGVIRVSGPTALSTVQKIFTSAKSVPLKDVPSHTCHFGRVHDDQVIDEVLCTVFRSPNSYTGEDVVEISAHGNPLILQKILSACILNGARLAGPGEFTQRAFLNGKMDLTQAEAVSDLIRSKTDKAHTAALAQLEGSLAKKVKHLKSRLLPLLAHIEVGLDHAEDDQPFLSREDLITDVRAVQTEIQQILADARTGKVLREGYRVALLGRPNVGKSSLMNALLREDRAIVTPVAGTTRDTLEETLSIHGVPVVLTDTAGLRDETNDPIERLGIARTRQSLQQADVVIGLFDASEKFTKEDERVVAEAAEKPHLWVLNKSDLPALVTAQKIQSLNGGGQVITISAKTGHGMEELATALVERAIGLTANAGEAHWLLNTRHAAALMRAQEALGHAGDAAQRNEPEECVALELQTALSALGEIIGETSTEELLGEVFSRFCIGK